MEIHPASIGLDHPAPQRYSRGFTLVELLITICIIAILASLTAVGAKRWIEGSRSSKCVANLRNLGVVLQTFAGENNGQFPQTGTRVDIGEVDSQTGKPSWIEQLDAYTESDRRIFKCPANEIKTPNSYFLSTWAAFYENAMTYPTPPLSILRIRQPSAMILAGDCVAPYAEPDADKDDAAPGLNPLFGGKPVHNGSVNILYADGHIQATQSFDKETMTNRYEGTGYDYSSTQP